MDQELVIVSYSLSLHDSSWLAACLDTHAKPLRSKSILLTDQESIHPVLRDRWSSRTVRFLSDGSRWDGGVRSPHSWNDIDAPFYSHECHAERMCVAAQKAYDKGYPVRTILVFDALLQPTETCRELWRKMDQLPGDLSAYRYDHGLCPVDQQFLVWLDTETTGLSKSAAVIEIGSILTDPSGQIILNRFEARSEIPSWAHVEPAALTVNGFRTCPRWKDKISHHLMMDSFLNWLPRPARLAGHNISFDRRLLEQTLKSSGFGVPTWDREYVDTLEIARRIHRQNKTKQSCTLMTLCNNFGVLAEGLHSAMRDIEATRQVYLHFEKLKSAHTKQLQAI